MPRLVTGKRRQKRTASVIPVRLAFIHKDGPREAHVAHTLDISNHGVKLGGLQCELRRDDVFELQVKHKRARFRVVWTAMREGSSETYLGAECLEPEKNIWGVDLEDSTDEYEERDF